MRDNKHTFLTLHSQLHLWALTYKHTVKESIIRAVKLISSRGNIISVSKTDKGTPSILCHLSTEHVRQTEQCWGLFHFKIKEVSTQPLFLSWTLRCGDRQETANERDSCLISFCPPLWFFKKWVSLIKRPLRGCCHRDMSYFGLNSTDKPVIKVELVL